MSRMKDSYFAHIDKENNTCGYLNTPNFEGADLFSDWLLFFSVDPTICRALPENEHEIEVGATLSGRCSRLVPSLMQQ